MYFSYSNCLAYENRVGQESRLVSLLWDSRDWVYYCDFSTGRISNYAHKMQIRNPCPRRNMLQGPDATYWCGQFYLCRWRYRKQGNFSPDAVSSSWSCAFWIWALGYYLKHVVMHLLMVGNTLLCMDSHWLQGVCSQTHSAVKIWPQAQCILAQQKFLSSWVWGKPCAPLWVTAISVFRAAS